MFLIKYLNLDKICYTAPSRVRYFFFHSLFVLSADLQHCISSNLLSVNLDRVEGENVYSGCLRRHQTFSPTSSISLSSLFLWRLGSEGARSLNPKTPWLKIWQPKKIELSATLVSSSTTSEWRAAPRIHVYCILYHALYFFCCYIQKHWQSITVTRPVSWQWGKVVRRGNDARLEMWQWKERQQLGCKCDRQVTGERGVRWKTVSGRKSEK